MRARAWALQHALERVVPQRDAAVAVEHRHALLEVLDHLAAPMRFVEPLHVVGIDAVAEPSAAASTGATFHIRRSITVTIAVATPAPSR